MYAEGVEKSVGLSFCVIHVVVYDIAVLTGEEYPEVSLTGYFHNMIRRHRDEDYGFQNR